MLCLSPIHGFSVNLKFVECILVSAKFRVFFRKIAVNRVHVDFVKVQGVFLVLPKFGCFFRKIIKVQGVFCKLTFTRSGGSFAIAIHGLWIDLCKV